MSDPTSDRIIVELTTSEAQLVVAALRQFEPSWPAATDDMSRAELLAGIRQGVDRVVSALDSPEASTS